ncbi:MAG: DUF1624 domain-containing protein [Pedobacter sp.]|nr:MAG: DUF1624 domain-containing protein [Pedobacter sp.]
MTSEKKRILSIDILRGFVMVVMALDHTRDFFMIGGMSSDPMNPETTNFWLYFTRWITHLCAPTFVFLSGISAYLSFKNKDPKTASNFLIKRGAWLLLVEVIFITFGLTFDPLFHIIILQVIWAIGWSMILLGLLSRISHRLVLIVGLIIFFGHNALNYIQLPSSETLLGQLITTTLTSNGVIVPISETRVLGLFYAILPWSGAMLIGFSIGHWYNHDFNPNLRKKRLLYIGLGLFASFLILRYFGWYGNPAPRKEFSDPLKAFFSFFNVSKYPPSLQFYGMTLGITVTVLSLIENVKNRFSRFLMVFGNVPFFYYVIHFYLIHTLLVVVFFASGYGVDDIGGQNSSFLFHPPNFGFNLGVVYLIWLSVIAMLYRPCIWFRSYKAHHSQWWLKYL